MEELDNLIGATSSPVELSELVGTPLAPIDTPTGAIRNRASMLALDSADSQQAVSEYQLMMAEGERGEFSYTNQKQQQVISRMQDEDKKTYMSILSDPNVPYERKSELIQALRLGEVKIDSSIGLSSKLLEQASEGESIEAEAARVGSVADAIREIHESNQLIQGLVNAHGAGLDNVGVGTAGQMADLWVTPFGNSVAVATLNKGLGNNSVWELIKSTLLPGSKIANIRKQLEGLPPEQRADFAKSLVDTISSNQRTIFSSDNQFAQYEKAVQIFQEGGYSTTEEWLDNVSVLLDIVGLGWTVRGSKGVRKLNKQPTPSATATNAPMPVADVPRGAPVAQADELPEVNFQYTIRPRTDAELANDISGQYAERIRQLEEERAGIMGEAGNLLDPGAVRELTEQGDIIEARRITDTKALAKEIQATEGITSKEAKKEAQRRANETNADVDAQLARIDQQLEANRKASTLTQRLADIDKQIEGLRPNVGIPSRLTPIADLVKRIEVNAIVRTNNPASPYAIAKQTNPQKAREFHEAVMTDESGETARALAGGERAEVIADDILPQAVTETKRVVAQAPDIERNVRNKAMIPEKIKEYIWNTGRLEFTAAEKAAAKANVVRKFEEAEGLTIEPSMSSFGLDGGRINISAAYGTPEGAFLNGVEAVQQAKYALRNMGIEASQITVLKREGRDFRPVSVAEANAEGAYMVRVDTYHDIDPTDIGAYEKFDVKFNFFDRLPMTNWGSAGSLQRHILDAASMLDKRLTGAASTAVDKGARLEQYLLEQAELYSDKYAKLNSAQKQQVDQYIKEANFNGWALDTVDLMARGMNQEQINALISWREFWDAHYYLENLDMVRTLRAQGFEFFKNKNAELFARPVAKNQNNSYVYDPDIDMVVTISKQDMDDLYDMNGTIAKLRRPTDFGGETTEYMIVRNNANSFLRKIKDDDTVLNYREGYYNVQYTAPRFIDEETIDKNGNKIKRAVAVAGDWNEATLFAQRMQRNAQNGESYVVRADDRAMRTGSDDWFDVNSAGGRIAQRHRGKILEDASGMNHLGDGSYVVDPVSSAIRAARSISGRTVMRPVLEAAKARFMQQYKDFLPSDGMGGVRFPKEVSEIGAKGQQFTKNVADARTTWEYIRYLENGYINGVDNFFKAMMHVLSEQVGKLSTKVGGGAVGGKVERGLDIAADLGPTQMGKNFVFHAYIGTNVLRQWVVQSHQAIRTMFYNPGGWTTGRVHDYMISYIHNKVHEATGGSNIPRAKIKEFLDFVDDSGMMAAVDKQNLVRGTLFDAAEQTNKVAKAGMRVLNVPRAIGFDMGERANMLGHMAAVYDKYKEAGKNLRDKAVRDEAYAEARALSYDMNFAGDMPYNQNAAGILLQFMQVPHKALLQLTNRRLPLNTRMSLLAGDMIFWGPPTLLVSEYLFGGDILPDDPEMREAVVYGAESALLNHLFRKIMKDEDINVDFSTLAPYDLTGWSEFFKAVMEGGLTAGIANSPAGQLYSPEGKVANAVRGVLRTFSFQEQVEETPEDFLSVLSEIASISSGFSNGMKAYLALKTGERYDKYGQLIDPETNKLEAWLEAFGFTDASRRDLFAASRKSREAIKSHKDEVTQDVKFILDYVTKRLEGTPDQRQVELINRSTAFALSRYQNDPVAQEIFREQLSLRMRDPNNGLLLSMMNAQGIPDTAVTKDMIRMSSLPEDQKKLLLQRFEDIENLR